MRIHLPTKAWHVLMSCILLFLTFSVQAQKLYSEETILQGKSIFVNLNVSKDYKVVSPPENGTFSIYSLGSLGKLLLYIPNPDFIGKEVIILEEITNSSSPTDSHTTYKGFTFNVKGVIANNDYYFLEKDSTYVINVADNDLHATPNVVIGNITKLNDNSAKVIVEDSKLHVYYDGPSSDVYLRYVICDDEVKLCDDAYIHLKYKTEIQENKVDTLIRYINNKEDIFLVMGFDKYSYIKRASKGYITPFRSNVLKYSPYSTTTSSDTITIKGVKGDFEIQQTFIIFIEPLAEENDFLANDFFRTSLNSNFAFNVLDNDLMSNLQVTNYTLPEMGNLTYLGDGEFFYEPHLGQRGNDRFTYTVCLSGNCEVAEVVVQIMSHEPQLHNYKLITSKNSPLIIRLNSDFETFYYNFLSEPSNGNLDYFEGHYEGDISGKPFSGYNLMVYHPSQDYVGSDVFYFEYCIPNETCRNMSIEIEVIDYQPLVYCLEDCVWPGDANNDGIVSGLDILSLGYNVGESGISREEPSSNLWIGQEAADWERTQGVSPLDMKFTDTDGDGFVSLEDKFAIDTFYMNTHAFHVVQEIEINDANFTIEMPTDSLFAGDSTSIFIMIGSEDNMIQSMNGFTFNFDFDTSIIDPNSIEVEFIDNNFFFDNAPVMDLVKYPSAGRIDISASRLTKNPVGGFGMAVRVGFIVIDDIDGFKSDGPVIKKSNFGLSNVHYMNGDGGVVRLPNHKVAFNHITLNEEYVNNRVKPYINASPNPSLDGNYLVVTDYFNYQNGLNVEVFDINGVRVHFSKEDNFNFKLNISSLPTGTYILRISDDSTSEVKKIQKL